MRREYAGVKISSGMAAMFGIIALCLVVAAAHGAEVIYRSPLAMVADRDGRMLYVAEYTANSVAVVDTTKGAVARRIALPEAPGGLALSPDGKTLYVTNAAPAGLVRCINTVTGEEQASVSVGHTPMAVALHPDGSPLYVGNRFNNDISVVDVATRKEMTRIPAVREPVALALTADGALLFVANLLPDGPADGAYTAATVSIIATASNSVAATVPLPNGSTGVRGICVSPDGRHAYATHILARYQLPTTQLERGWMNTNALSIINAETKTYVNTVLLDDVDAGAPNPWGIACTPDGRFLCVTHAGTHEISIIDRVALHEKLDRVAAGERVSEVSKSPDDVPNDLSFLVNIRRRIRLAGNGPRSLVLTGNVAYAGEYFTDSIGVLELPLEGRPKIRSIALANDTPMTQERDGARFFNDAALCFQQWQSCTSCHPDDRVDALNWDLLNDGIGNPKNTKSMLLSHETPPAMSMGVRDTAETAVRAGIRHIQFAVRPESDADAIDAYLKSLRPVPSPYLQNGELSPAAMRGKAIFERAGCAECHPAPLYTNLQHYDVGTGSGLDAGKAFDTPTLVEVWRTAPYLHDGRAATMLDVFKKHNNDDKHGNTSGLTDEELADLVEFVLSL
mgnify:FL=1